MPGFYQTFTTPRATQPDPAQLFAQLRALDATVGIASSLNGPIQLKKNSAWTAPQIAAAQNVLDTAPAATPQLTAQSAVDSYAIEWRALVLALIDQLNIIRTNLPTPLGPITPAQAIAAIRAKAGAL